MSNECTCRDSDIVCSWCQRELDEERARTCGQCKYWNRAKPYKWGECAAPLPQYVGNVKSTTIFAEEKAFHCEMFSKLWPNVNNGDTQ